MSKHTPGPWEAQRDPNAIMADDWCIGAQGQIDMVAVCSERDARLISAAPDLLEALKDLFGADMVYCMMGDGKDDQIEAIAKARAAIAKATGEQA